MAATIRIRIINIDKLHRRLNRFPEIAGKHISRAINQSIAAIEAKAIPLTPVKTGRLKGSYTFGRIASRPTTLRGRVKPDVFYAAAVHDIHPPGFGYFKPSKNKRAVAGFLLIGKNVAEPQIGKQFDKAIKNIANDLGD